jgi:hypothetical protein
MTLSKNLLKELKHDNLKQQTLIDVRLKIVAGMAIAKPGFDEKVATSLRVQKQVLQTELEYIDKELAEK